MYLVTEPWYFANHRLDHARALIAEGFDVQVATRRGDRWDELVDSGCDVHEIDLGRGAGSFGSWIGEVRALRRLVRRERPDVVHAVALKPVALAVSLLPMRRRPTLILGINGLGISATEGGLRLSAIRAVVRTARRMPRVFLLFQTRADQRAVVGDRNEGVIIPGVGVDLDRFRPGERPAGPPYRVVYLGRAVTSKGLLDLASAVDIGGLDGVELHLYCALDETSPGALGPDELARLEQSASITLHEPTRRAESVMGSAHAAILPSRAGEGVSKFVLEALACGAPVLLSAESGSAEVIEPGRTGIVFDAGDSRSIRSALLEVAGWSPARREAVSDACRAAAEREFGLDRILPRIVELHRSAVAGGRRS